jgi:DNA-binding transcriptional ArsR family regulator
MPTPRDVPPKFARALADPVRIGVLTVLRDGPMSEATIAARLGTDARTVARHARELAEMGLVGKAGQPPVYEHLGVVDFPDEVWEELSTPVKRAAVAATLAQVAASASAAVDAGGFDSPDMHLTRTTLELDETEWRVASRKMLDLRAELLDAHERAAARRGEGARPGVRSQAVLMLFAGTAVEAPVAPHDEPPAFSADEGRARIYELYESLDQLLVWEPGDLSAALDVLDELRVVIKATALAERGDRSTVDAGSRHPG